ncbi:MAG TPA: nucleotide exchange factor GrpE [Gemmatimonadaceae bacterium]|nr:nucleotide exchange factor GrpE [Gemmatimonadaceae bacterium]
MRNSKKKPDSTPLPDQETMGSADDYASGASQGDGQSGDPTFASSAGATADAESAESATNARGADPTRADSDIASERERYLRLAAEYDNYRKRSMKERQDAGTRAQGELVRQLIEALDDVARFAHVDPATTDATTVVQGVDMVEKKLLKALGNAGLEIINPVGETFDPALHEAVATEPTSAREDDHVVSRVYQPGYVFKSQLLRPARVVVKQWNG